MEGTITKLRNFKTMFAFFDKLIQHTQEIAIAIKC